MGRADSPLLGRMIFNVGARRSGTFWLQRLVTAHPSVGAVPSETHLLSHGIAPLLERFQHEDPLSTEVGRVYVDREQLMDATRDFCDAVFCQFRGDADRVAERTPLHVFHLDLLAEIYPDARYVHIIRDGRDVARSIASQAWGPETVAEAAREWREAVEAARSSRLGQDRLFEVRYEELLADPGAHLERLYGWLDLPTTEADLAYPLTESRRALNVDQRGGGVGTAKWRAVFAPADLAAFEREAGDLLDELGYPRQTALARPIPLRKRARSLASRLGPNASR